MDLTRFDVSLRSVRKGRFKLIERSDGRTDLFDLAADPGETADVSAGHRGVAEELSDLLTGTLGPRAAVDNIHVDEIAEREMRERLELLGYL
jgi:hypothetical protein